MNTKRQDFPAANVVECSINESRPSLYGATEGCVDGMHQSGSLSDVNEGENEIEALNLLRPQEAPPSRHAPSLVFNYGSVESTYTQDKIRRKLRFFFMNPIEKWQAKRRFPYKFAVQLIKLVLVTIQLCLFASSRYNHVNYTSDNKVAFSHLFLKGWDATREVISYPPALGPLAIYRINSFYETLDYAIHGDAIGPYSYPEEDNTIVPPTLCVYQYKEGTIFGFNESYVFNSEVSERCLNISVRANMSDISFSKAYLEKAEFVINFSALTRAVLNFSIKTVNFKAAGPLTPPDCYRFNIQINFDNSDHDGQVLLSLFVEPIRLHCNGDVRYIDNNRIKSLLRSTLNSLVIVICSISFVLCCRAIYRAQQLKRDTIKFFKKQLGKDLDVHDRLEFLNMWYITILLNDIMIIVGSAIKEQIENKQFSGDQWNSCSVLLGTGNLLVWFGLLRYLGFFKTYNVLILTMKRATPIVVRFLLCCALIYAGFTFCGWVVLGPYHMKFRSVSSTSECLFSLINGDDMFATFSVMSTKSTMLWWYCRLYLYSFISLFIYVVLSLFIAIIEESYDTIKQYYLQGFPRSDLHEFISQCEENTNSSIYRCESSSTLADCFGNLTCCCRKERSPETDPLT